MAMHGSSRQLTAAHERLWQLILANGSSRQLTTAHGSSWQLMVVLFLFQGAKTGKDNGYTMLFDIESFDYSYYDEGSEGLKVALVHHLDMPIMRQTGFHIAPGENVTLNP